MIPVDRETALEQLLASGTFAGAARSQALLRFLAQRAWVDGDAAVNEVVIALDHLGRDARTFDPKTDSAVRVELSRLRKRLETCFAGELSDAPWRITLPSGSYAPQFVLREVTVPAEVASPKAAAAPVSPAVPAVLMPQISPSPGPWRRVPRVAWACAAVVVVAVSGWALWQSGGSHVDPGDVVAVLPFTCAAEPTEELFCDGLADEVLDKLVQVPELKVIARTSSFKFKGKPIDAREAGKLLGAKYLVEGSLQREGDNYKLVAQMVRTSDGAHVVSRLFRRSGGERLRLQSDLAELVADALALNLRPAFAHTKTDREELSADALVKWNRATRLVGSGNEADQNKAMALLDEVLTERPNFARAWATKASLIRNRAYFGENVDVAAANALPFMRKAAELAPDEPGIQAKLAFLEFLNRVDIRVVYARLKTLAERNPNHAAVQYWWGTIAWLVGRLPEAAEAYRVSQVLSPLDVSSLHMRSRMLLAMGGNENLVEALSEVDKALAMDANFVDLYHVRGKILLAQGRWDAGKADLLRGIVPLGPVTTELWAIYFDAKDAKNGAELADVATKRAAVVRKYGPSAMPFAASSALATGQPEEAIAWAQKAVAAGQEGSQHLAHELHDSAFLAIRDDPRMQAVYDHIGSSWAKSATRVTASR